jgi:hypothetical protein
VLVRFNHVASGIQQPKQKRTCKVAIPKNGHLGVFQLREDQPGTLDAPYISTETAERSSLIKRGSQHYLIDLVHRVADCIIWRVVPQATEWQHIGNQIDATLIFARPDFINVDGMHELLSDCVTDSLN